MFIFILFLVTIMNKTIKILITTSVLCNAAFAFLEPIYAIFVQRIGGFILEASISMGLYAMALGIVTIIIGKISDNKQYRAKLIVAGYALAALAFLGYYFVKSPWELFAIQIVLGVSSALIDPGWNALFGTNVKKNKEATEWGLWEGAKQISIGIASIVGGIIAFAFGFKILILVMFVFEVAATINVSRLLLVKQ
jgi:MFS family permease